MMGEPPGISASLGTRYKSPVPRSTYAPGSLSSSQTTSGRLNRCCGSTDLVFTCSIVSSSFLVLRSFKGVLHLHKHCYYRRGNPWNTVILVLFQTPAAADSQS